MNLIDKTISKWERGLGYSDVNLLGELSNLFEINIEKILNGNLETNALDSGNFRRLKFYVCPVLRECNHQYRQCGDFLLWAQAHRLPSNSLTTSTGQR